MIKNMLEATAFVRYIYNTDFRNLVERPELGAGESINGKVDFVFVDQPYDVQRDPSADSLGYGLFSSEYMTGIAKMLDDLIKPEAIIKYLAHHAISPSGTRLRKLNL